MSDVDLSYIMVAGPYTLNTMTSTVSRDGQVIATLTRFEMTLLAHLAGQPGTVISKEMLTRHMYNGRQQPESNGLEVFIGRIRRKIDPGKVLKPLQTVRFSGYRFRNDWEVSRAAA